MDPSVSEDLDEPRDQFNLGAMLLIALAAVVGTTLTVWAFHFLHIGNAVTSVNKPLARIAVLPFHSLSSSPEDIQADRQLTSQLTSGLSRISRVESIPSETDADPVTIGRELGVNFLLIGKVERSGSQLRIHVQMISAHDGRQLWTGNFNSTASNIEALSDEIDNAVAPHLTALLD